MEEYKRVYITKDNDGHDYILPYESRHEFNTLLELSEIKEYAEDLFIEKFSEYMTGGDINSKGLYIKTNK